MEELQRVDIKLSKEILRWAAVEAAKEGISRRQFLAKCIEEYKMNYNVVKSSKFYRTEPKSE